MIAWFCFQLMVVGAHCVRCWMVLFAADGGWGTLCKMLDGFITQIVSFCSCWFSTDQDKIALCEMLDGFMTQMVILCGWFCFAADGGGPDRRG